MGGWSAQQGVGNYSIAIGVSDGANVSSTSAIGAYSIAIGGGDSSNGHGALATDAYAVALGTGSVAAGVRSTAVGAFAGNGAAGGNHRNSSFGEEAGQFVTGAGNTAIGLASGNSVTGSLNSALGNSTGGLVTGNNNTAGGVLSGVTVKGASNAAYGDNAGRDVTGNANIAIGLNAGRNITASDTIAMGTGASAAANAAMALGNGARATKPRAVAIGSGSVGNITNAVSVGAKNHERRIVNVAAAVTATDAVNLGQVQAMLSATVGATVALPVERPHPAAGAGTSPSYPIAAKATILASGQRPAAAGTAAPAGNSPVADRAADVEDLEPSTIVGWANVGHDGALSGSRNITGNARHGVGDYEVVFAKPSLRRCTYSATLGSIGFVSVTAGAVANSLKVETRNHYGVLTDAPFRLIAVC